MCIRDSLQLVDILPGQLNIAKENYAIFDGYTSLSWNTVGQRVDLKSNEPMFILQFETSAEGILSQSLQVSSKATKAELYETIDLIDNIELSVHKTAFTVYQNEPNPFSVNTTIAFDLPENSEVGVSYYNSSGQLLRKTTNTFSKGRNEIRVSKEELNHSGLIYYKIDSEFGSAMRKMILLD